MAGIRTMRAHMNVAGAALHPRPDAPVLIDIVNRGYKVAHPQGSAGRSEVEMNGTLHPMRCGEDRP